MEELLAKYFSGESTQDEINKVNSWRNESDEHAKVFVEAKNIWISTQPKPEANKQLLDQILGEPQGKQVQVSFGWIKYAAAAVVVIGLVFVFKLMPGERESNMTLADGSEIVLHGESMIESVSMTDEVREVRLSGKGYFDIKRDESRPFIIITENARIEVLGTSFQIDSYNGKTEVSVESGSVALIKPAGQGNTALTVTLAEGEVGMINSSNKGIIKKNNNNANYLAWKTKTLVFNRSKLSYVESTLEDVYGIDIVLENPNLKNCNLTAKFKGRKPKDAMEILARTFNLTYEFEGNDKVILRGKGC